MKSDKTERIGFKRKQVKGWEQEDTHNWIKQKEDEKGNAMRRTGTEKWEILGSRKKWVHDNTRNGLNYRTYIGRSHWSETSWREDDGIGGKYQQKSKPTNRTELNDWFFSAKFSRHACLLRIRIDKLFAGLREILQLEKQNFLCWNS